jgi:gliding motility-associated-like protein
MCESDSIVLDAGYLPIGTYLWNTGNSGRTLTCDTPGKYWVTLTSPYTCAVTDSVNVQEVLKPNLELGPDTALCKIDGYILNAYSPGATYLWHTGSIASFLSVLIPGKYEVQVTYRSCTVKDSVLVTQKPVPVVDLGSDRKSCAEDSITLDAGNTGSIFLWNDLSFAQIKTVKPPGLFYVSVTNPQGCQATDTLVFDTFVSPFVSLGPDSAVCEDMPFVLDAGAGFGKYTWTDGTGNRTLAVTATGTYAVTVEDRHYCKASDAVQVIIHPIPSVELSRQLLLCKPDTIIRLVGNFAAYLWQDSSIAPYFHITGYGVYSVKVTDEHHCWNTATMEVVNDCPPDIFVPNAFTPNQDGNNDLFFPVAVNIKSISWKIYNRWGQMLFETDELKKGWDGLFESEAATSDVYVYVIYYVGMNDQSGTKKGNVTLLR